jgi:DNA-binding SARP family transcriptional activator
LAKVEYRILGPLEVVAVDGPLPLGGPKQRSLLALLLLHANEVVSADSLIDRLWGGKAPPTAAKILQVQVWRLRKTLGRDALITRPPGYLLRLDLDELDLARFERLVGEARGAEPAAAADKLREALSLWRGDALADLAYESSLSAEIARLGELRLLAMEERIEAELALGRHADVVSELGELIGEYPYREGLRARLMLALYRSGRQAEALEAYQDARAALSDQLGLEPGEELKRLEQAILRHEPELAPPEPGTVPEEEEAPASILVAPAKLDDLAPLLDLAARLGSAGAPHEVIVAQVVGSDELAEATAALARQRTELVRRGVTARTAAFSSPTPSADVVRLTRQHEVSLLLTNAGPSPLEGDAVLMLEQAPCDVALLLDAGGPPRAGPVLVPFGAAEHDWAALELGAWFSRATDAPLKLIGAASDSRGKGRDASRLLADASLIVQRTAGVMAEPLLATPGRQGVTALARDAGLLIVGFSERWRQEGMGKVRGELAKTPPAPTVFVRRGLRPGGLAATDDRTRFTWSLTSAAAR